MDVLIPEGDYSEVRERLLLRLPEIFELLKCHEEIDKSAIEEASLGIATSFAVLQGADKIRLKQVRDDLREIKVRALDLAEHLRSVNYVTASFFNLRRFWQNVLPKQYRINWSLAGPQNFAKILDDMAQTSDQILSQLPQKGPGDSAEFYPLAKQQFVTDCLHYLFDRYRPGEATTTVDSDFQNMVSIVYEIATGKEIDLEWPIKQVIKARRLPKRKKK